MSILFEEQHRLERMLKERDAEIVRLLDALKAIECSSIDHTDACRMAGKARAPKP